MDRAAFLRAGGALVVTLAAGQGWLARASSADEIGSSPAYEPWRDWDTDPQDSVLAIVRAAILAANATNTQPWLFRITQTRIEIFADAARNLGAFDPFLREMHFSLGCAIENAMLAAAANGHMATLSLEPGVLTSTADHTALKRAATIDLEPGSETRTDLYEAIPNRHTNRGLFSEQDISRSILDQIRAEAVEADARLFLFDQPHDNSRAKILAIEGGQAAYADADVSRGLAPWMRSTLEDAETRRDGVFVGVPPSGPPHPAAVDAVRSGKVFGLIAVRDRHDQAQTVRAGRLWQRVHLRATALGIAGRPANGAIHLIDNERFRERPPLAEARLAELTGDASWQPTFMFYLGYTSSEGWVSARRGAREVLV